MIAGSLAGFAAAVIVSPLDVLKTRLQSTDLGLAGISRPNHRGYAVYSCLRTILRTEGTRSLFKGLVPTIAGIAPCRALYFHFYVNNKPLFAKLFNLDTTSPLVHLAASGTSGVLTTTIVTPLFFIRTRLQLVKGLQYGNRIVDVIRIAYRENGVRTFYRGVCASYFGALESMCFFVSYEMLRPSIGESGPTLRDSGVICVSSIGCKLLASLVFYPHEVIRTRQRQPGMQDVYSSVRQTCKTILRQEGLKAFYAGLKTSCLRQVPNTAITMTVFELLNSRQPKL